MSTDHSELPHKISSQTVEQMPPKIKRFAGLDLAKTSIFACILDKKGLKHENRFDTTPGALLTLKCWLSENNVVEVVMENTGIYTEPVINCLKPYFTLYIVNAADTKRNNKKKTDQDDAWWLAELLMAGTIGKDKRILVSHIVRASIIVRYKVSS